MRILLAAAVIFAAFWPVFPAGAADESEPNNTSGTANSLNSTVMVNGAIDPTGDLDFFNIGGSNTTWGVIALLDTSGSSSSKTARLTMHGADGSTVLQQDVGSWERGAGIALQRFTDGSAPYYLSVREEGDNALVDPYSLRFYKTIITSMSEVEPNDTRSAGTPSSFTMNGVIGTAGDVDCFSFHGRAGDTILLALDGDPEGDGSPVNFVLELISPTDAVLKSADATGTGGNEFIEYSGLASEGVYAYCVRDSAGGGDPAGTYLAGIVRNEGLYYPPIVPGITWTNPPAGNAASIGADLTFRVFIRNDGPLAVPGVVNMKINYPPECLEYLSAFQTPSSVTSGYVNWNDLKTGLAPGEEYANSATFRALKKCEDTAVSGISVDYFLTGWGPEATFTIKGGANAAPAFLLLSDP